MFDVFCDKHGARVLLGASRIVTIDNVDGGIEVAFRCYCGHRGVWRTGRANAQPALATSAA